MKTMTAKGTGLLAAAAVALGMGAATPARADGSDVAKVVIGFALLAALANAVDKGNDSPRPPAGTPPQGYWKDGRWHDGHPGDDHWRDGHDWHKPRPAPVPPTAARTLPPACLGRAWNGDRWFHFYGARCLARKTPAVRYPSSCRVLLKTGKRVIRPVYSATCLGRYGFRVAAR